MKERLLRERFFIFAIIFSAVWHIFWLSVVSVTAPKEGESVKFSKISFLGPILERAALQVKIEPSQRSFLETRFLEKLENLSGPAGTIEPIITKEVPQRNFYILRDDKAHVFIKMAVRREKLEPPHLF